MTGFPGQAILKLRTYNKIKFSPQRLRDTVKKPKFMSVFPFWVSSSLSLEVFFGILKENTANNFIEQPNFPSTSKANVALSNHSFL
jgi:hypothetical protein